MRLALCSALLVLTSCGVTDQATEDARWATVTGGVAARIFISDLSATTLDGAFPGGWSSVTDPTLSPPTSVPTGGLTAVVAPFNVCEPGQVSNATHPCYSAPNRVGITIGYKATNSVEENLGTAAVNETAEIDVTIKLNTIGQTLRWTWMNAELTYWQLTGLGTSSGSLRIKMRPALAPTINWANHPGSLCTTAPLVSCDLNMTDGAPRLVATLVLSLDTTLDAALAGAAFATSGAVNGYVNPSSGPNRILEYSLAGPHYEADGITVHVGSLRALLSLSSVTQLYPDLTTLEEAVEGLTVSRVGSGSQTSTSITSWTAGTGGTDGIVIEVAGITFSVPKYQVAARSSNGATAILFSPIVAVVCVLLNYM